MELSPVDSSWEMHIDGFQPGAGNLTFPNSLSCFEVRNFFCNGSEHQPRVCFELREHRARKSPARTFSCDPTKEIQWPLLQFVVHPKQTVVSTVPFISSISFISFIFFISLFVAFASFSTLEYTTAKTFGLDLIF